MATKETERKVRPAPEKGAATTDQTSGQSRKSAPQRQTGRPGEGKPQSRPAPKAPPKEKTQTRRRRPETEQDQPARQKQTKPAQEVVYLPPKPFLKNRLILQLLTLVAVVVALILGVSVFFKVELDKTQISGCEKYSTRDILEASGIKDGDHLLTLSRSEVAGRIISALPYVEKVRVGIHLPDTVNIQVTEVQVAYAIRSDADVWWLISSAGKVIEPAGSGAESGYTKILGVRLEKPEAGQQIVAYEDQQPQLDEEGNPLPVAVTQAMRLDTAMDIIYWLEQCRILGKLATIDVTDLNELELWYGQQYQVLLGTAAQMEMKISALESAVRKLESYQKGILDISLTIWPDRVGYTPFTSEETEILPNN